MGVAVRQTLADFSPRSTNFVQYIVAGLMSIVLIASSVVPASANPRYAAYVMDANTGQVLFSRYADDQRYPASLTKMMTLYMLFEAMHSGKVAKSTPIPISAKAAAEPPTKIGLRAGATITAENAILSLVTRSANDIATAIGEFLGGSEQNFARMMTAKARQLGMNKTTFQNAHGLPNNRQVTTARDMAILGIALREHYPQYYSYFGTREFTLGKQRYGNHNRVLGRVRGADGIKTGYIRASGFNLVSSVQDDGRSIVAVVMGGQSGRSRDDHMVELIREHLPKASRSKGSPLVARGPASSIAVASSAVALPTSIPTPQFRPHGNVPMSIEQVVAQAENVQMAFAGGTPTTVAAPPSPVPAADVRRPQVPAAVAAVEAQVARVDPIQTSATPDSSWVIQVASMPNESDAKAFLVRTKTSVDDVLINAEPFTETFDHNGQTYYRARYSGFQGKDDAWATCAMLKKHNVACYAVQM